MEKKSGEFILENKGLCFLCSHRVSSQRPSSIISQNQQTLNQSNQSLSVSTYSFQHLANYLQIDMGKVFSGDGPIPPHLLAKVQKSKLKVELCTECASVNKIFSELYQKLEKITMEVGSLLQIIMRKLQELDEEDNKAEESEGGQMMTALDKLLMKQKAEIVKTMRKETKHKCDTKLKSLSTPCVRIQNFTVKEITGEKDRLKRESLKDKPPSSSTSRPQTIDSESEPIIDAMIKTEDFDMDIDQISTTDLDEPHHLLEGEMSHSSRQQSNQTNGNEDTFDWKEKYILDAKSDEHTCRDCSMKFVSFPTFYHHYNRQHRKISFECSACKKTFTQVSSLNSHQRTLHKGVKFSCPACNQLFSLQSHISKHRKAGICKPSEMFEKSKSSLIILRPSKCPKDVQKLLENSWDAQSGTHKCSICSNEFEKKGGLKIHLKSAHLKIRYKCGLCQAIFNSHKPYRVHHLKVHVGVRFPCPKCKKVFEYEKSLSYHLQHARDCNVQKVKKMKKEKKPLSKTEVEIRKALIIIHHEETSKFQCSICSKEYSTNKSFRKHYTKVHLNINYTCSGQPSQSYLS